jgi:hypothetical protein
MASSLHESLQEKIFTLMYPTNSTQGPFQGQNQNPFQRQGEVDERDLFVSPISPKSVPTWNKSMSNSASIFQRRSPTISVSNYSTRPSTALPAAEESHQSHDGVRFGKVEWSPQQDNAAFKSPPAAPNMSDIISSDQFQDRDGLEKSGLGIHIVKGERKEHDSTGSQVSLVILQVVTASKRLTFFFQEHKQNMGTNSPPSPILPNRDEG